MSSLAGLPEKSQADNGQSVLEALEEIAEGGKDSLTLTLAETEAAVSMFRSKMRWMPVAAGGYVLPAEGGEIVLFEVPGTEGWTVTQAGKGTRAQGLTLGYAQGFGEDIALGLQRIAVDQERILAAPPSDGDAAGEAAQPGHPGPDLDQDPGGCGRPADAASGPVCYRQRRAAAAQPAAQPAAPDARERVGRCPEADHGVPFV